MSSSSTLMRLSVCSCWCASGTGCCCCINNFLVFKHFSEAAVFVDEHLDFVLYFFAVVEVVAIVIEFFDDS